MVTRPLIVKSSIVLSAVGKGGGKGAREAVRSGGFGRGWGLLVALAALTPIACGMQQGSAPEQDARAERSGSPGDSAASGPTPESGPALESGPTPDGGSLPRRGSRTRGEDWPSFLGPTRDGKSTETGILTDWTEGRLRVVWTRPLGTSYGIGSVAAGRYFQFDREGNQELLHCLDAETGELLWSSGQPVEYRDLFGYNNGPRSSPEIDGDRVYTHGVAGRVTCRRVEDGEILWSVDTASRYGVIQNFFGAGACPVVLGDQVWVMVGGSPPEDRQIAPGRLDRVRPHGSALVAFDKYTGEERHRLGDYLASYSTPIPVRWNDQRLGLLAFVREGLLAVDPVLGREDWFVPWRASSLESVNAAVPVVQPQPDGATEVLISECYEIGSALIEVRGDQPQIVRRDGRARRDQSMRAHWATPIEVDGLLYGCSGRNPADSDLRCVDWETGEAAWVDARRERTSLLYVDGHFVVLGESGQLQLIEATGQAYRLVSEVDLSERHPAADGRPLLVSPCWAAPILSHGLLYVRGDDRLVCLELIPEEK